VDLVVKKNVCVDEYTDSLGRAMRKKHVVVHQRIIHVLEFEVFRKRLSKLIDENLFNHPEARVWGIVG
jgi:hypothetical protein